jgi:hypothetical protein
VGATLVLANYPTGIGMIRSFFGSITSFVYLVVGAVIADDHKYFAHMSTIKPIASAALAVVLWPLVLLGVNLHIH